MSLSTWMDAHPTAGIIAPNDSSFDASVRDEISSIVENYKSAAAEYSSATEVLWSRIGASLEGGKLTRPRLVKLGYDAFTAQHGQEQPQLHRDGDRLVLLGSAKSS